MANNTLVKHEINCRGGVIWPFSDQDNEICGTAHPLGKRMKNFSLSLAASTQYVNSDGVTVGSWTGVPRGTLTLGLSGLTPEEKAMIHGQTIHAFSSLPGVNGNSIGEKDIAPYLRAAWITDREDGKVNLYKVLRVKFQPNEKSVEQINESGNVTFSTISLQGDFFNSQSETLSGKLYTVEGVDPTTTAGATFITNWTSIGDFVGAGGISNNSRIKVGAITVPDGGTIDSGSTITFEGLASGGESPYTYAFAYKAEGSDAWTEAEASGSTGSAEITVVSSTVYYFRLTATDSNGVTISRQLSATIVPTVVGG